MYDPARPSVEAVLDSSRYFVVRIEDAGKKAYIASRGKRPFESPRKSGLANSIVKNIGVTTGAMKMEEWPESTLLATE